MILWLLSNHILTQRKGCVANLVETVDSMKREMLEFGIQPMHTFYQSSTSQWIVRKTDGHLCEEIPMHGILLYEENPVICFRQEINKQHSILFLQAFEFTRRERPHMHEWNLTAVNVVYQESSQVADV